MPQSSCNLTDCFLCRFCILEWRAVIALKKKTLLFKRGGQIFKEGEKVNGIYFVYSGSVKIHKQWAQPKELIIRFAKAGNIIGHRGLGGSEIYPISATAMEDTKVCFITNEFLEVSLKTNHSLTYQLMQFYALELQKAEKRMRDLAHMEVKGRIATALLDISKFFGVNKDEFIALNISRQDIASFAGTTYETVFKFFQELVRANIISTSGKFIKLNDPVKLRQFIIYEI
jgi:CRP-like cAMP-binding protein